MSDTTFDRIAAAGGAAFAVLALSTVAVAPRHLMSTRTRARFAGT